LASLSLLSCLQTKAAFSWWHSVQCVCLTNLPWGSSLQSTVHWRTLILFVFECNLIWISIVWTSLFWTYRWSIVGRSETWRWNLSRWSGH
jgi:hypothetical protein